MTKVVSDVVSQSDIKPKRCRYMLCRYSERSIAVNTTYFTVR